MKIKEAKTIVFVDSNTVKQQQELKGGKKQQ